MQVAIYTRVSTERREREQTIDSQLARLRAWPVEHGHTLEPEHVYTDEGNSGSRLDWAGLERLRDAAREAEFSAVAVLSPDRLARRYAYQVLLVEALRRVGYQLVFLLHPISDDLNDRLLPQIQKAVAEYERAVLGERFRRGGSGAMRVVTALPTLRVFVDGVEQGLRHLGRLDNVDQVPSWWLDGHRREPTHGTTYGPSHGCHGLI